MDIAQIRVGRGECLYIVKSLDTNKVTLQAI